MVVAYLVSFEHGEYSDKVFAPCAIYLSREFADVAVERAANWLAATRRDHDEDDYGFWDAAKDEWGNELGSWYARDGEYRVTELPLGDAEMILTMGGK